MTGKFFFFFINLSKKKTSTVAPILAGLNLTSPECIWELYKNGTTTALNCMTGYP